MFLNLSNHTSILMPTKVLHTFSRNFLFTGIIQKMFSLDLAFIQSLVTQEAQNIIKSIFKCHFSSIPIVILSHVKSLCSFMMRSLGQKVKIHTLRLKVVDGSPEDHGIVIETLLVWS